MGILKSSEEKRIKMGKDMSSCGYAADTAVAIGAPADLRGFKPTQILALYRLIGRAS